MDLVSFPIGSQDQLSPSDIDIRELQDILSKGDPLLIGSPELHFEEDTMPSTATNIVPEFLNPYSVRHGPPEQTVFPGQFHFTAQVSKSSNNKKYLYSESLNKMYLDMGCDFAVQFEWAAPGRERMFVRACVVFADKEHAQKRVECCMQHRHAPDVPEHIRLNILHSSRALGTQGVYYQGEAHVPDAWYSVLVEFPADARPRSHAYKFVCKNSCSTGINRRAIAIVFTLEDAEGTVYGRQVVGARVCSCPPRDCRKDELDAHVPAAAATVTATPGSKKRLVKVEPGRCKKVKIENTRGTATDQGVYTLPQLQVVGANTLVAGLEVMSRMMEQGANLKKDDPQYVANCHACIASLRAAIDDCKNVHGIPH